MEKTILIAGKNMPDAGSFTDGVAFSGRNIIITGPQTDEVQPIKKLTIAERKANQAAYEEEKNLEAKSGICTIEWNKSSPLSARSLVQSAQPIISYNYGAKLDLRVSQTLRLSLLTAATCGIIVMLTMIAGSEKIVGMFLRPEENAYGIATCGLPWFASCSVFFALNVAFIGYYQSVTNASRAIVYTVLRGIIFPLATFMLLPSFFGATGLWLAIPAAEMVTLLIIVSMQFRNKL